MSDDFCVSCATELLEIDKDPNGDPNATCKRCVAEEDHDFDADPHAVFSRSGERTDPPKAWRPVPSEPASKPVRMMVDVEKVEAWIKVCQEASRKPGGSGLLEAAEEMSSMVSAAQERQKKRGKK